MLEVTFADRQKAARIIQDLRRDYPTHKISDLFGIRRQYLAYCVGMQKHRKKGTEIDSYICPKWVIRKIIERGKLLGAHRIAY